MNGVHPACWSDDELLSQCRLTFSRASGPGGQNRNKVETCVQIEFLPAGIIAIASERRSQNENRNVAIQRLRCKLAVEFQMESISSELNARKKARSETWQRYCRDGRVNIAETNAEWPAVLAEVITCFRIDDWNIGAVADELGTSSSQLVKLLKKHAPAFSLFNQERSTRGQRPLT